MTTETTSRAERVPLTRERVFDAAIAIADRDGIESLTMRRLADELGVEAMSLYYHVANKEAILDGVVDAIIEEIEEAGGGSNIPDQVDDWKSEVRRRLLIARQVMLRHKWAPSIIETRTEMGLPAIRHFHAILGIMRKGGFSYDLVHHGMHALGSRALGFSQELFEPDDQAQDEATQEMMTGMADQFPYMVEMLREVAHEGPDSTLGWCDDQTEFEFGLDLILDGLERLRLAEGP